MSNEEICSYLFNGYENFLGIGLFIELINKYEDFRNVIIQGINDKTISGIPKEDIEKFKNVYPQWYYDYNLYEGYLMGGNIGRCTTYSIATSYIYSCPYACGGTNKYFIDTPNCKDGSHTWINLNGKNIDTSLMIVFPDKLLDKLGYNVESKEYFTIDKCYYVQKEMSLDTSLRR